ncbi:MAG: cyclic nucleotide-binding domain-containing protein [Deltaproteobacteria bacterium]|nr:cyclic nucleotide-binding domain-containing protein [Deltaproteobacteria bacterium]
MRIAIIGGGAAGMGAAKTLIDAGLEVTLFEELPRLGGHCFAVPVPHGKRTVLVDAGVSDFNRVTSHEVRRFMADLGLEVIPVLPDSTCTTIEGHPIWTTKGGRRVIDGIHDEAKFFADIDLFQATCVEVTAEARFSEWSARRYLDEYDYGPDFRRSYFNPRAGGAFPMPDRDPEDYFIRPLVAFWQMEGLVGGRSENARCVIEHGMHAWPAAFHIWFEQHAGQLRIGTRVVGVSRRARGVRIRLETEAGAHESLWFDHVIFAASPHAIRSMLEDPSIDEAALLGAFQWQRARVAVHRDAEYVCSDPMQIAAYNYVAGQGDQPEIRPTLTIYPKRLANQGDAPDVFVTINPHRQLRDVIANRFFVHPALSRPQDVSARRISQLQGASNTWYAGGWLRVPHVHEQALASGIEVGVDMVNMMSGKRPTQRRLGRRYIDALRDSPIFASLDPCLLEEIRITARPFEVAMGEVITREGEPSAGMVLIEEGEAIGTRNGKHVTRSRAGALIGELSILDGGPSPLTFVARTAVSGWFFDPAGIEQLRRETSAGAFAFLDQIARTQMKLWRELLERRWGAITPADAAAWTEAHVIGPASGFLEGLGLPESHRLRALLWELPAGMLIVRAGEASNRFLIVTQGRVDVTAADGTPLVDAGPGDMPGVLAVIDGGRQPFSFIAREPTIAAVIDADRFRELRYGGSPLAAALVPRIHSYLVERYRPLLDTILGGDDDETMVDREIP